MTTPKKPYTPPTFVASETTFLIRKNERLRARGEAQMMFPGEHRRMGDHDFVAMPTPEGVDGCTRCHWQSPANCIGGDVIDTLGSCTGGKRIYFMWSPGNNKHKSVAFKPVEIDEPDGLGY